MCENITLFCVSSELALLTLLHPACGITAACVFGAINVFKYCDRARLNLDDIYNTVGYDFYLRKLQVEFEEKNFQEFIRKDPILKDFLCQISGKLPLVPAVDPDENVYEYAVIKGHLERHAGAPYYWLQRPFTVTQLRFDFSHARTILERVSMLIMKINPTSVIRDERVRVQGNLAEDFVEKLGGVKEGSKRHRERAETTQALMTRDGLDLARERIPIHQEDIQTDPATHQPVWTWRATAGMLEDSSVCKTIKNNDGFITKDVKKKLRIMPDLDIGIDKRAKPKAVGFFS